jgi:hypothetical protein
MLRRLRSTWLAGGGAFLLVVSLSGIASAAHLVTDTQTFVDLDGNGVADSCDALVAPDPVAAATAFTTADTDADGTISVTEAAHSGWIGGANCNHGGYVSSVAKTSGDTCDTETPPAADGDSDDGSADGDTDKDGDAPTTVITTVSTTVAPAATDCATDPAADTTTTEAPAAVCPVVVVPPLAPVAPVDTAPNAHGKAVSLVAQSDAVGGKNCNHGGAVSAAAKKDHGAAADAKAAAKAAKHTKHAHGKGHKTQ